MTGIHINQEDLPWWVVGVLGWLSMVQALQQSYMDGWPERTRAFLRQFPPERIYDLYSEYANAVERERRDAARKRQ